MTKGKRNAVIVMSVAVLLLVSMAVGAGIVGTDKILSLIGGKSRARPRSPAMTAAISNSSLRDPRSFRQFSSKRTSSVFRPLPI